MSTSHDAVTTPLPSSSLHAAGVTGPLRINASRLLERLATFAEIGRDELGGVTRPGFSEAERVARSRLAQEARGSGLSPTVDAAGNLLIRRPAVAGEPADRPVLLIGSHLDSVVNGGALDGTYGVLAALEALETIVESREELTLDVVVVAFANEEGALFPQPFWGSMVVAGRLDALPPDPRDHSGRPLREQLALAGGDLSALDSAVWPPGSLAGYLELHVEQGPVLERAEQRVGVVDVITGRTVLTVEVRGVAGHAGTTPMERRQDPVPAAARVVLVVERLARDLRLCRVATVGRLDVIPNSPNAVADTVRITVDLRDGDADRLRAAETDLENELETIAAQSGVRIDILAATRADPVQTHPSMRDAIERGAKELGLSCRTLPSGAGHDAQIVADIAPVGLIFVPSIGGVSHVPAENTAPEDLAAGGEVLLRAVVLLASRDATRRADVN